LQKTLKKIVNESIFLTVFAKKNLSLQQLHQHIIYSLFFH